jgi:hypothetical protein
VLVLSRLLPTILRKLRRLLPVTAQVCRYGGGGMRGGFACLCLPLLAVGSVVGSRLCVQDRSSMSPGSKAETSDWVKVSVVFPVLSVHNLESETNKLFGTCFFVWQVFRVVSMVLFIAYPSVSIKIFRLFNCTLVEGRYWIAADMRLECYTSAW